MAQTGDFGFVARYQTIVLMTIALGAAALAWLLIFLGDWIGLWHWTHENRAFASDGAFLIWLFLILGQAAAWPIVAMIVIGKIREVDFYYKGNWREVVLSSFVFGGAALAIGISGIWVQDLPRWLPGFREKLTVLTVVGVGVALLPAIGIWRVQGALRELLDDLLRKKRNDKKPDKLEIDRLLHMKDTLALYLGFLGFLLTAAIVAAGAERKAVDAWGQRTNHHYNVDMVFPSDHVLLYGLLLTLLVSLVYAPAHISYLAVGRRLRDDVVPMLPPSDPAWQSRLGERASLEDVLDLRGKTDANLKAAAAVVTPLIGSLIGLING